MQYHLQPWGPRPSWSLKWSWCSLPQGWGAWLSWGCCIPHRRLFQLGHQAGEKVTHTCQPQGHSKLQPVSTLPSTPHPVMLAHATGLCPCWSLLLGLSFSLLIPLPSFQPTTVPSSLLSSIFESLLCFRYDCRCWSYSIAGWVGGGQNPCFHGAYFSLWERERDKEQNR